MKVITLNHENLKQKCNELVSKIEGTPDLIIGVFNGGGYVLSEIRDNESFSFVELNSVKLQRRGKFRNSIIAKFILKRLPYRILDNIRGFESEKAKMTIDKINFKNLSSIKLNLANPSNVKTPKRILIVDDAIDTGKTMFVTKNNLAKLFPSAKIEIGVISWTIETSIIKPDYYLYKNILIRFPWSKDYKGKDFEKNRFSS